MVCQVRCSDGPDWPILLSAKEGQVGHGLDCGGCEMEEFRVQRRGNKAKSRILCASGDETLACSGIDTLGRVIWMVGSRKERGPGKLVLTIFNVIFIFLGSLLFAVEEHIQMNRKSSKSSRKPIWASCSSQTSDKGSNVRGGSWDRCCRQNIEGLSKHAGVALGRKRKICLELNLVRNVKHNREDFCRWMSSSKKAREGVSLLWN